MLHFLSVMSTFALIVRLLAEVRAWKHIIIKENDLHGYS